MTTMKDLEGVCYKRGMLFTGKIEPPSEKEHEFRFIMRCVTDLDDRLSKLERMLADDTKTT